MKRKGFIESIWILLWSISILFISFLCYTIMINKYYVYYIRNKFIYDFKHAYTEINTKSVEYLLYKKIVVLSSNYKTILSQFTNKYILIRNEYKIYITKSHIVYYRYNKILYQESIDSFIKNVENTTYIIDYNNKYLNMLIVY